MVAIRLDDGTVISLAGDTRVAFPAEDRNRLDVEHGNVTAAVRPRPAGHRRQPEAQRWHTLTLPLHQFHRAKAQDSVRLTGQLVALLLVFDSPEHNPGLTVDRLWVPRGMPAGSSRHGTIGQFFRERC